MRESLDLLTSVEAAPAVEVPPGEGAPAPIQISAAAVTRFLVIVAIVIHLLNVPAVIFKHLWSFPHADEYIKLFAVSGEGKLPTFFSGMLLLSAGALLGLIAFHARGRRDRFYRHWSLLTVIFVLLSMDEMMVIHEMTTYFIRSRLDIESGLLYQAWVIPAIAVLVLLGLAYLRFVIALPPRTRALFLLAAAIYLSGVVGLEMIGGARLAAREPDLTYAILASVEEVLEMGGMILFLYALMDHLHRSAPVTRIRFGR